MWSRAAFKGHAKTVLSKSYWTAFLACLLGGIITTGITYTLSYNRNTGGDYGNFLTRLNNPAYYVLHNHVLTTLFLGILGFASLFLFAIRIVYIFFVASPITVGKSRFFLSNRKGECDFVKLFFFFKKARYIDIVKAMAWRYLFNFLWTLLFIIPGIVKYYAYSMVPYILADNPNIGYDHALKLSMNMTHGHKSEIFVLQLSFIGWYLLGLICCFIGVLFLNPYYEATFAETYGFLRKTAIQKGICNAAELNLTQGDYVADNQ